MQSGTVLSSAFHYIPQDEASYTGLSLAKNLNCQWCQEEALLECLQGMNASDILAGQSPGMRWMPTIVYNKES